MTKEKQRDVIQEQLKLITTSCELMMQTIGVQSDPIIIDFLSRSYGHLFECRYWLSESVVAANQATYAKKVDEKEKKN